jgi:lipoyl(octanoyl) transferase
MRRGMMGKEMTTPLHRTLVVHDLGRVEYEDGLAIQSAFAQARRERVVADTLLLVEHPPSLTLGRAAKPEHVKASQSILEKMGVRVFSTDRGGDATYHGPGQVVGYPILDLKPDRCDVRRYVNDLEEAMISTAADFGVQAGRIGGWVGVWLGEKGNDARKLGAIGVHLSRWITTHGFAFNVGTDLSHFDLIVPCGISQAGVTSLERELQGRKVALGEVKAALARHLAEQWGMSIARGRIERRTISMAVLREGKGDLEALLLKRHPHRGGFWQPVTGTLERGEIPRCCAQRELNEETGIRADAEPLDYIHCFLFGGARPGRPPRIYQETAFYCLTRGDAAISLDNREHCAFAWLPIAEAIERAPFTGLKETLRRAARAARAKLGHQGP